MYLQDKAESPMVEKVAKMVRPYDILVYLLYIIESRGVFFGKEKL
jgi:hypothetical protein